MRGRIWPAALALGSMGQGCSGAPTQPTGPRLEVSPDRLDFGTVRLQSEASLSLTITSTGAAPVAIDGLKVSAPFDAGELPGTLAPGGSLILPRLPRRRRARSHPRGAGDLSPDLPNGHLRVPLTAVVVAPSLQVEPSTLILPLQQPPARGEIRDGSARSAILWRSPGAGGRTSMGIWARAARAPTARRASRCTSRGAGTRFGSSLASPGDMDGDGLPDLLLGADDDDRETEDGGRPRRRRGCGLAVPGQRQPLPGVGPGPSG